LGVRSFFYHIARAKENAMPVSEKLGNSTSAEQNIHHRIVLINPSRSGN
jgi:hypothetical protein